LIGSGWGLFAGAWFVRTTVASSGLICLVPAHIEDDALDRDVGRLVGVGAVGGGEVFLADYVVQVGLVQLDGLFGRKLLVHRVFVVWHGREQRVGGWVVDWVHCGWRINVLRGLGTVGAAANLKSRL